MLDIAANEEKSQLELKILQRVKNISDKYLEQIVAVLNKGGMVRSIRGPQGYTLKSETRRVYRRNDLFDRGSLAPIECVEEDAISCERQSDCITYFLWKKLMKQLKVWLIQ